MPCAGKPATQNKKDGTIYPVPLEVINYRVPAFFNIHPAEKQTTVSRCRGCVPERRKAFQRVRLEDKKLQL
jgi:hypothetical protein